MALADVREAILLRLESILAGTAGIVATGRNRLDLPNLNRPGAILQDGSEIFLDAPGGKRARARVQRMEISPRIDLHVRANETQSGPLLSAFRSTLVKAIVNDGALLSLVGDSGEIRYDGASVPEPRPESKEPRMEITFAFVYTLRVDDL